MKLLVIGLGKSGSKIADAFAQMNKKARIERGVSVLTSAYAISNNREAIQGLTTKESDSLFRLLITSFPEGRDEVPLVNMETVLSESERILSAIRRGEHFESAAFLVIASGWGSFGATLAPILTQKLKERYTGKPVYGLILFPFKSEEMVGGRRVYNMAVCLKTMHKLADAVILVDNEKIRLSGISLDPDYKAVNEEIVAPFYDLLSTSEAPAGKRPPNRVLGVGDIIQALSGFTAIGSAKVSIYQKDGFRVIPRPAHFKEKGEDTTKTLEAMNLALARLSIEVDPKEASRAVYLLSAPPHESTVNMAMTLGNRLNDVTQNCELRGGEFEGERSNIQVDLILSQLAYIPRVKDYYERAAAFLKEEKAA